MAARASRADAVRVRAWAAARLRSGYPARGLFRAQLAGMPRMGIGWREARCLRWSTAQGPPHSVRAGSNGPRPFPRHRGRREARSGAEFPAGPPPINSPGVSVRTSAGLRFFCMLGNPSAVLGPPMSLSERQAHSSPPHFAQPCITSERGCRAACSRSPSRAHAHLGVQVFAAEVRSRLR